jgi:hypothetical protein
LVFARNVIEEGLSAPGLRGLASEQLWQRACPSANDFLQKESQEKPHDDHHHHRF